LLIVPTISDDSNSGYVNVGVNGFVQNTQQIFLLEDGKYVGQIGGFRNSDTLGIDVSNYGNQVCWNAPRKLIQV
jgi:hypothetical protein